MVDFSSIMGLLKSDAVTYNYKYGDVPIDLTPTGLQPAELLDKLYKNGAKIVIIGDTTHTSPDIIRTVNSLLEDKSLNVTKLASEFFSKNQQMYDDFAKGNEKKLREHIAGNDFNAPSASYPELREQYFAENQRKFDITRAKGIKVGFVDHYDEKTSDDAAYAHNRIYHLKRDYVIALSMRTLEGKPKDVEQLPRAEFDQLKESMANALQVKRISFSKQALKNTDAASLVAISKGFFKDIGLDYNKPHNPTQIKTAYMAELESLEKAEKAANNARDESRNKQMADNVYKFVQQNDSPNSRTIFMVGSGHLGKEVRKEDKGLSATLEQMLIDKLGKKVVRVDILPIDNHQDAKKLGVAIGGIEGADYTIFIPGAIATGKYFVENTGKSVPAKDGPHKDKLKALKISQIDLPADQPRFALGGDEYFPGDTGFNSGLGVSIPKGSNTKHLG